MLRGGGEEGGDRTQVTKIDPDATHANTKGVARTFLLDMKILECAIPPVPPVSSCVIFAPYWPVAGHVFQLVFTFATFGNMHNFCTADYHIMHIH